MGNIFFSRNFSTSNVQPENSSKYKKTTAPAESTRDDQETDRKIHKLSLKIFSDFPSVHIDKFLILQDRQNVSI